MFITDKPNLKLYKDTTDGEVCSVIKVSLNKKNSQLIESFLDIHFYVLDMFLHSHYNVAAITAFIVCILFSASSNTID